jgi:hypothetical protein
VQGAEHAEAGRDRTHHGEHAGNGGGGGSIEEFQGLYGAYHISETLLQRIWLRRDFDESAARLTSGEPVAILHPGAWNRLGGPDFHAARLRFGDRVVEGDIEVHFRAEAWAGHGHNADPAYENVVLHVVLFPPAPVSRPARTGSGREIATLVLVDLLWHDLEEYAADDAISALSGCDPMPLVERLLELPIAARMQAIADAAGRRWREKVRFAGLRIARLGWENACHHTALEILGYRSNRTAMLKVATRFGWDEWRETPPSVDDLAAAAGDAWSLRGVRPANHPRLRLGQYCRWMAASPEWPARLREFANSGGTAGASRGGAGDRPDGAEASVAALRRGLGLRALRDRIAREVFGDSVAGTRVDTLVCNLVLPFLAAACSGHGQALGRLWHIWPPGDFPDHLSSAARHLRPAGVRQPACNGFLQGVLSLQIDEQRRG